MTDGRIFLETLFRGLLVTSIYGGILGLVLMGLKKILGRRLSPQGHYLLWMVLVLRLILPVNLEAPFSVENMLQVERQMSALGSKSITYTVADQKKSEEIKEKNENVEKQNNAYGGLSNNMVQLQQRIAFESGGVVPVAEEESLFDRVIKVGSVLWLSGSLLLFFWFLLGAGRLRGQMVKGPTAEMAMEEEQLLNRWNEQVKVKGQVALCHTEKIMGPGVFGIFQKRILMGPVESGLKTETLSYALLHELCHLKRGDHLMKAGLLFLKCLHWFNPILWISLNKMEEDMELATDERALSYVEPVERKEYGRALIDVLETFQYKNRVGVLSMGKSQREITRRIQWIKDSAMTEKNRGKQRIAAVLCLVFLSGLFLTAGVANAQGDTISTFENKYTGPIKMPVVKYSAEQLYKYRKTLPTENGKLKGILMEFFPRASWKAEVKKVSGKVGLHIKLEEAIGLLDNDSEHNGLLRTLRTDTTLLFCLVPKLEYFQVEGISEKSMKWTRAAVKEEYKMSFSQITENKSTFSDFLKYLSLEIKVSPEKYSPAMSSVPGIGILPIYSGEADQIVYSVNYGELLEWDPGTGKITSHGQKVTKSLQSETIYWSPMSPLQTSVVPKGYYVTVAYYLKGKVQAEKTLRFDAGDNGMFHVIEVLNERFQDLY